MRRDRYPALVLAGMATGASICMSILAGWQRGGWVSERVVWVAVGVVLVAGVHLLPALCRSTPAHVRLIGGALWFGCLVATDYGHGVFFLLAQRHAGDVRASAVTVATIPAHRDLTVVMSERASVSDTLATANVRRCIGDCPTLRARRVSLAARLDALDAEAADIERFQRIEDRNVARRDSARDDPVTNRIAVALRLPEAELDLVSGLLFASVLECVACLLWWIALAPHQPEPPATIRPAAAQAVIVTASNNVTAPVTTGEPEQSVQAPVVTERESEVTRLLHDVQAGLLRPTVSGIRQHLGCSQAKAAALRKQVISLPS